MQEQRRLKIAVLLLRRSRPSVPDFLYRPPCQQQLLLLHQQLHAATRSLLLLQVAAVVKEALRRWAREFLGKLRAIAAADSAATKQQIAQRCRGALLLQQWVRLRRREDSGWAMQRLRMHALLQQQQQQTAAVVAAMASGHLELASNHLQVAQQQLKYALNRLFERRLHAAFLKLRMLRIVKTAQQQTEQGRAAQLCWCMQKQQNKVLHGAFVHLRRFLLQRQQQQRALQQLLQHMRLRRLKWGWQRLVWFAAASHLSNQAKRQQAIFLVSLCIRARMRSSLRQLQRHAAAANTQEKLRICSNMQQVSS